MLRKFHPKNQDVTGYPTLKFFKSGAEKEDGVKYRGNRCEKSLYVHNNFDSLLTDLIINLFVDRDAAALEKFIAEKLGHEVPEEKPAAPESAEVA